MMRQRFAQAASSYDQFATIQELSAELISNVELTHYPTRILDIGCGTGYLTQKMANKYPQSTIDAVDASASMIKQFMGRNLRNTRPICASYNDFLASYQYDLIVSNAALHWMNISQSFLNISLQLAKKGVAIFTMFGRGTSPELRQLLPVIHRPNWVVSDAFMTEEEITDCGQSHFKSWCITRHKQMQRFDSVMDMLTTQKKTGVNAKQYSEGLWTPRQLKTLEDAFMMHYGQVQLSYEMFLCIGHNEDG